MECLAARERNATRANPPRRYHQLLPPSSFSCSNTIVISYIGLSSPGRILFPSSSYSSSYFLVDFHLNSFSPLIPDVLHDTTRLLSFSSIPSFRPLAHLLIQQLRAGHAHKYVKRGRKTLAAGCWLLLPSISITSLRLHNLFPYFLFHVCVSFSDCVLPHT